MVNYYGLAILVLLMIPNIVYSIKNPKGFENKFNNKKLEYTEQIGRIGTFVFLILNIPKMYIGFWFDHALTVYLFVNGILIFGYILSWILMWKINNLTKMLLLSIIPISLFLFCGIMILSVPLIFLQ